MSSPEALLAEARARMAAAWPAATDASDRASPVAGASLPAFAVVVERQRTEPLAMDLRLATDLVRISWWQAGGDGLRAAAAAAIGAITATMLAAPARLGGLADELEVDGSATELEDAEVRVARSDVVLRAAYPVAD